ncbi:hypothetical protein RvY_03455-2 [Ramazzottius varieornatus]|uniref:J domain-containing protein n=1 Tax=Ramazzottius varieornatus TaxID=947166 RepID=A0A1D1UNX1_RAMVA|nr:hypothetical protein RvY_03455-2 [Ramazzottius varieornatus]
MNISHRKLREPRISNKRLQRAKEILTDEKSREDYDTWRRSGISLPYEEWIARKDSIKMSMHWATKAKQEPAIESGAINGASGNQDPSSLSEGQEPRHLAFDSQENTIESRVFWSRNDASDLLNKFRNYEI